MIGIRTPKCRGEQIEASDKSRRLAHREAAVQGNKPHSSLHYFWKVSKSREGRSMAKVSGGEAMRDLSALFDGGMTGNLTDGQLLERFATRDDAFAESAFEALV